MAAWSKVEATTFSCYICTSSAWRCQAGRVAQCIPPDYTNSSTMGRYRVSHYICSTILARPKQHHKDLVIVTHLWLTADYYYLHTCIIIIIFFFLHIIIITIIIFYILLWFLHTNTIKLVHDLSLKKRLSGEAGITFFGDTPDSIRCLHIVNSIVCICMWIWRYNQQW